MANGAVPKQPSGVAGIEPFRTMKVAPWRFAIGMPVVLILGLAVAVLLARYDFGLAIGFQIGFQAAGFLWLYVPVQRRLERREPV